MKTASDLRKRDLRQMRHIEALSVRMCARLRACTRAMGNGAFYPTHLTQDT
jgi:hypothetical protein